MRLRYSLRALLIAVTLICLGIGWLALPTLRARQFVSAMAKQDYTAAERLFTDQQDVFPGSFKEHTHFEPRVSLKALTWRDLISRERNLFVGIAYGDGSGIASCSLEIKATPDGLEKGMMFP